MAASTSALQLSQESARTRERYGLPDREDHSVEARKCGGRPHLGPCMLAARHLIEAGVRLVTVCTGRRIDQSWDTHRKHFPLLERSLLPYTDRASSALLEETDERGMLDDKALLVDSFHRAGRVGA